jgi:adenosylhomocysteine nucleosidase
VIAVTFALPTESAGFRRLLREQERHRYGNAEVIRGKIDSRAVEILHTGVGEKLCRRRVAALLQDRQFDLLISAGFAGALDERLEVGDIVIAENFSTTRIAAGSFLKDLPVKLCDLTTVNHIIDSPPQRAQLAQATGAAAVDMETDFIAQICAEHALPMLALRAISDTPARPLPLPPGILFDLDKQKTRPAKLSLYILRHPTRLPRLIGFARQVRIARRVLTRAVAILLCGGQL